jgi:uncharacterized protein (TIGR00255 family)
MVQSMTGFGRSEKKINSFGAVTVEIRTINHKFLETVIHLPAGFLALEDRIKKEIETRISRGRVTCVINIIEQASRDVVINQQMVAKYVKAFRSMAKKYALSGDIGVADLVNLPGVVTFAESRIPTAQLWPGLHRLVRQALDETIKMRLREGQSTAKNLISRNETIRTDLEKVKDRFKKAVNERSAVFATDAERASFLKESDITEEIERLDYHLKSFRMKIATSGSIGKELDFIAQEMQREANTMGAKSCDPAISGKVVEMKSQIEKMREQLQNIV